MAPTLVRVTNGPGPPAGSVTEFAYVFDQCAQQVSRALKGKQAEVRLALTCVFAQGHLLVEDVPGVGKTTLAKALAASLGLSWTRAQFTPDLLPSDITGASVFEASTSSFSFRPGPIFTNVFLADEINRASPKAQAALLEAMQELQVSVDGTTHGLRRPFVVIATQNPFDHEGTYPLPTSELDRFLVRLSLGYPDRASEVDMLQDQPEPGHPHDGAQTALVLPPGALQELLAVPASVYVAPALQGYMVDLARATRQHPAVATGLSPRALVSLQRAARAWAASQGRDYVLPDDIKALLRPVAEHRLVLVPEMAWADQGAAHVLAQVAGSVPVPVPGLAVRG